MFAPEYKQQIPKYIHTLGVVTADTGAAVRDIIQIASRRNPFVQIICILRWYRELRRRLPL